MNLGEEIKKLRTSKKMTQSELAERIGVTKATISAYEGSTRLPSYEMLITIARLFHVSIDNLLGHSNKSAIDTSGLTQKQKNTINEVVSTYRRHNSMYRQIMDSDSIEGVLKDMGLVDKLDDWLEDN